MRLTVARDQNADAWIADDSAWEHMAPPGALAMDGEHARSTVLATSPFFMVSDAATANRLGGDGATWLGLASLLQSNSGLRVVVDDPAGSGAGMLGAGAVAEAVWVGHGMDASAVALETIVPKARTIRSGPALPRTSGEVGVVPEYALLPALASSGQTYHVLAGGDISPELRFTLFPLAKAASDPRRAAAVDRLRSVLTGDAARHALDAAGLRPPNGTQPPSQGRGLVPPLAAPALDVLGGHHVDHVFASWYRNDRRLNLTMVVDVSWSMSDPGPRLVEPGHRPRPPGHRHGGRHAAGRLPRRAVGVRLAPGRHAGLPGRSSPSAGSRTLTARPSRTPSRHSSPSTRGPVSTTRSWRRTPQPGRRGRRDSRTR